MRPETGSHWGFRHGESPAETAPAPGSKLPPGPPSSTAKSADSRRAPSEVLELNLGDVLRLRKSHPCGGYDWEVTRLGADIGLRCLACGRRVLLERPTLEKRLKTFISHAEITESPSTRP